MTYTVKSGDTLSKIAKRNGVTLTQLRKANPQIENPNKIKVGQVINVPAIATPTDNTKPLPSTPAPVATAIGALGKTIADSLGMLSAKYETGGRGPGTVSTGRGDKGGVSYGSYQMASKMGVPKSFVTQAGFPWLQDFQNLVPGTPEFSAVWRRIAAAQADAFQKAQHEYIKKTHYDVLCAKILSDDNLDVNSRSRALQDVVWSTAVQHGGKTSIVHRACTECTCARTDPKYDEELIRAIYAERGRKKENGSLVYFSGNSANVQKSVANRFKSELQDALAMLAKDV